MNRIDEPQATAGGAPAFFAMARRSIVGFYRQPSSWIIGGIFPLLISAVSASAFSRATRLSGFPDSDSFLQFLLAGTILQGTLFGSINASTDLAIDIENGFMDRLLSSPVSRVSILLSRLAGAATYGALITVLYSIIFSLFGVKIVGAIPGIIIMILLSVTMAVGVGGYGAAIGLRTGSAEAVSNSFPLIFISTFVSSAFFPVETMSGVYGTVARYSPITFVVDSARYQILEGFSISESLRGFLVGLVFAGSMIAIAISQLNRRLADAA